LNRWSMSWDVRALIAFDYAQRIEQLRQIAQEGA
jgi:hypothetical protein